MRNAPKVRGQPLSNLLKREDVLLVDTETTGLDKDAEVIEVVAIDTMGAVRLSVLSLPEDPIRREASEIHGLTVRVLKGLGAKPWPKVHGQVKRVLESAQIVLAWNAQFDARMLQQTADRHRLSDIDMTLNDLMGVYKRMRPGKRYSLGAAMSIERLKWSGESHRAEADCRAMLSVLERLG